MGLNGSLFPGFYLPCCLLRTSNQLATLYKAYPASHPHDRELWKVVKKTDEWIFQYESGTCETGKFSSSYVISKIYLGFKLIGPEQ